MDQARRLANESRLKLLEAQLEPHMLFNTLANLRVLIATDPTRAQDMLDRLISFLRATLSASRSTQHSLQNEFDRLRDYLDLMAVRMGPRLTYELDLPENLSTRQIPTLLLQPVVENSIKHGLEPKIEGGLIRVQARQIGQQLQLQVTDSGVGPADNPSGSGFGQSQIRERLASLHGDQAHMQFGPATNGVGACTTITLPLLP